MEKVTKVEVATQEDSLLSQEHVMQLTDRQGGRERAARRKQREQEKNDKKSTMTEESSSSSSNPASQTTHLSSSAASNVSSDNASAVTTNTHREHPKGRKRRAQNKDDAKRNHAPSLDKDSFQVHVSENASNINICVRGPNPKGLMAVLLLSLLAEEWNVLEIIKKSTLAGTEEAKVDMEEPDRGSNTEHCIVAQAPGTVFDDPNLNDLEHRLLAACDDFVSSNPSRALQSLMNTFLRAIDPNFANPDGDVQPLRRRESGGMPSRSSAPGAFSVSPSFSSVTHMMLECATSNEGNGSHGTGANLSSQDGQPPKENRVSSQKGQDRDSKGGPRQRNRRQQPAATAESDPGALKSDKTARQRRAHALATTEEEDASSNSDLDEQDAFPGATHVGGIQRPLGGSSSDAMFTHDQGSSTDYDGQKRLEGDGVPIAAEVVEDDKEDLEIAIREKIMMEATSASVVPDDELTSTKHQKYLVAVSSCACFLVAIIVVLVIVFVSTSKEGEPVDVRTPNVTLPPSRGEDVSTLATILSRGHVRCAVDTMQSIGQLETNLCRAVNAAIFGNASQPDFITAPVQDRFKILSNRTVDVLMQSTTHTGSRSVMEETTGQPFAFSSPYYYDGLVFGGRPEFVECADRLDSYFGICRILVVCVKETTTHVDFLRLRMPDHNVRIVDDFDNVLEDGSCNVLADGLSRISESLDQAVGGSSLRYVLGSNAFTREPLSIVTRHDDFQWSAFVETVLQGLLEAESRGISASNSSSFPEVPYFGPEYEDLVSQAVESVGNFGSINTLLRVGLNQRWTGCDGTVGLIYSFPFGGDFMFDTAASSMLVELRDRKTFRCGVPDTLETLRFHVELCRAISAALYGSADQFDWVTFANSTEGFDLLLDLELDVILGIGATALPSLDTRLQQVFLTKPYFFNTTRDGETEAFVMATAAIDEPGYLWFTFVQWTMMLLILAEENFVTQTGADTLALDSSQVGGAGFGQNFQNMIVAVGNYGEIYERTIDTPRAGCNRLNTDPHGAQHFPFLFEEL